MTEDCNNGFTINRLSPAQWQDLAATFQVGDEDKEQGLLATYYPEPDWKNIPNQDGEFPSTPDKDGISLFPDGKRDTRWYEWRVQHWGTKWDVYNCCNDFEQEVPSDEFHIGFCTAWSPPSEECLAVISQRFPGSLLTNYYEVTDTDSVGVTVAMDGIVRDLCEPMEKYREPFLRKQFPDLDDLLEEEGLNLDEDLEDFFCDNCDSDDFSDFINASQESLVKQMIREVQVSSSDCLVTA